MELIQAFVRNNFLQYFLVLLFIGLGLFLLFIGLGFRNLLVCNFWTKFGRAIFDSSGYKCILWNSVASVFLVYALSEE